jgi:choline transport protein
MATLNGFHEKQGAYSGDPFVSEISSDADGQDAKDMARMGKKQEFKRNFNWISSVGFTSCTMGT